MKLQRPRRRTVFREKVYPRSASRSSPGGRILALVLAGGKGERLFPLTRYRAKPAVPFGGACRLIDFVLSNLVNSSILSICVLAQAKPFSLLRYLQNAWPLARFGNDATSLPEFVRMPEKGDRYLGTADAVYKNLDLVREAAPDLVLVFGADHVYRMDINQMIREHLEKKAEATVAAVPMPVTECARFGTLVVDDNGRIRQFKEKSPAPVPVPGRPDQALVSMGNYIFNRTALIEILEEDAGDSRSGHDFGRDIFPRLCRQRRVYAYDYQTNVIPGAKRLMNYWRDVGTIESYYRANMDLNNPTPPLDLYDAAWPVRALGPHDLPVKVTADIHGKMGCVEDSILSGSTVVSGGYVKGSVIGNNVTIGSGAVVIDSLVLGDVVVHEGARIRRAIVDHGNVIERGARIGFDPERDRARYHVDASGVTVVAHALPRPPAETAPAAGKRWELRETASVR
jgi:glucose-1-phosphate adenylyltransferase